MKALRQMGSGFIIGTLSLLLVIGGISLSLAETSAPSSLPPTPSPIPTTFAVEFASPFPTSTLPPPIPTDTPLPMPSATLAQVSVTCTIPNNWIPVTVGTNDTLYTIAQRYNTTVEELNEKNCLNFSNPAPGIIIYVPAVPTKVVVQCFPPATWVKKHVVQKGDNLYRIALSYGLSYPQLQSGNCMGSSVTIFTGQVLWVPNISTFTPAVTSTSTINFSTSTNTATKTPDFSTPTNTATKTPDFSTPTNTATPIPPQ